MVPENKFEHEPAGFLERLKLATLVAFKIVRSDELKGDPVFPRGYGGEWTDAWGRPFSIRFGGSSKIDYTREVGDLTTSSLVMAVVNFVGTMLAEAPPQVLKYDKSGKGVAVPNHPLVELLKNPNPYYDFSTMMKSLALSLLIGGNNYWLKQRDPKNYFQVNGLWYLPEFLTRPRWSRDDPKDFISSYRYTVDAKKIDYLPEDIVHMRGTPDPMDPRVGMGVFNPVIEEIYGDKKASAFGAVLFKNLGIVQYVISPPKPTQGDAGGGAAGPGFGFGRDEDQARAKALRIQDAFIRATTGDNAGKPVVNTIPLEITKLSFSPQELDMKELRKVPESRVAGVSGIPAAVLQFIVGLENGTSYASYEQAREQGYEQVIIPMQRVIAAAINKHLLPEFPDPDGAKQEFQFDLSEVRVLQDDEAKLYTRLTAAVQGGWLQVADALASANFPFQDTDRVYLRSPSIKAVPADEAAAKAVAKLREQIGALNPEPPPPLPPAPGTLPPRTAPDNSGLPADGDRTIAGQTVLNVLRKELRSAISNGHTREEKELARSVMGLLGTGRKASIEYDGMTLWRDPTALEKSINLKAIQDAFDDGEKRLQKELAELREKLLQDAIEGIIELEPADYHTLVLATPDKASEKLREELQAIYDRGRELVLQELEAQGAQDLGDIGTPNDEDVTMLDDLADATVSRVINDVQARTTGAAVSLAILAVSAEALREKLTAAVEESSSAYIATAAAEADHVALGLGRLAEAEDRSDLLQEVYYSAILDQNTCDPCAAVDGDTATKPEDLTPCPNPDCEGGAKCRCVHIYVFDDSSV